MKYGHTIICTKIEYFAIFIDADAWALLSFMNDIHRAMRFGLFFDGMHF